MKIYENLDINDLENEIWKDIEEYPDYMVSNFGRVKRIIFDKFNRRLKVLKQYKRHNYLCVDLSVKGKQKNRPVHILVFEIFYNNKLKLNECVHHIDEDKENNNFENLIMMLESEHNILHNKGENNPNFGKHHSEESKKKISENNPNNILTSRKVVQIKCCLN